MNRINALGIIVGLAISLVAGGVACGGSGPTLSEYMKSAERLDQEHETKAEPLRTNLDTILGNLQPDDKVPSEAVGILTSLFNEEADFADNIQKLDAPKEAQDIQNEAVAALQAEVVYGRSVVAGITADTTFGEINDKFENDQGAQVNQRRTDACLSLQHLADNNNIAVDMTC
jgi:hypothetical protein